MPARNGPSPSTTDAPSRNLIEILVGIWRGQAVHVAAELRLADHLAAGHTTLADLAQAAGADPDALRRLLRLLVSLEVFAGDATTGYALTSSGELLRSDTPGSMRDLARLYGSGLVYQSWGQALHSVRTGECAVPVTCGAPLFDYLADHPEDSAIFDAAMAAGSAFLTKVADVYDFSAATTVVDVGGGQGVLLGSVLATHRHLRGVLLDSPQVLQRARAELATWNVGDRVQLVDGDFFTEVPSGGDVYVLSRILHDWDDERCLRLLRNCRAAVGPGGCLLVIERVLPDGTTTSLAVDLDLHMLVITGGRERTRQEYEVLLGQAGFGLVDQLALELDVDVLVAEAS